MGLRVLLSCVSENRPGWYDKVYNLVLSVRSFGGSLADARVVVNFVDGADPEVARTLEGLGAEVRVVERFDARNPYANKLRMLELGKEFDFDVLVALLNGHGEPRIIQYHKGIDQRGLPTEGSTC